MCLIVEASANHEGAALQQRPPHHQPGQSLGFLSTKWKTDQENYSAIDCKFWARIAETLHLCFMFDGQNFSRGLLDISTCR
jgi:hypothetical protein